MPEKTRLIIRARPGTEAALVAARLQQIAAAPEECVNVEICPDPETARAMLRSDDAAILCQVYTSPERFLSQAVRIDGDLEAALGTWAEEARDMLALHRQNRNRSLLFEAVHLCRYSDTGLTRLGFSSGSVTLSTALEDLFMSTPLPGLIAQAHLHSRPAAVELREELDASAQLLSNDVTLVPPLSADLALQDYRAQALRLAEAEQERDTAKDQIRTSLESLKALRTECASKDASLRAREEELDGLRAERDGLDAQASIALRHVRVREEDIERLQAERDNLEAQVTERDASLRAREEAFERLQTERDGLGARVAERDASLRARQKEIESLQADLAGKEAALGATRQDISRVSKERDLGFGKRDGRIADLDRTLQERQDHVQVLEAQIEQIMTSRSMRVTAPLRHLRALFSRRSND